MLREGLSHTTKLVGRFFSTLSGGAERQLHTSTTFCFLQVVPWPLVLLVSVLVLHAGNFSEEPGDSCMSSRL